MAIEKSLVSGSMTMLILKLLSEIPYPPDCAVTDTEFLLSVQTRSEISVAGYRSSHIHTFPFLTAISGSYRRSDRGKYAGR